MTFQNQSMTIFFFNIHKKLDRYETLVSVEIIAEEINFKTLQLVITLLEKSI